MSDVAAKILGKLPAGVEAEVVVQQHDLALTRFANSYIHQNVAGSSTEVRLRLHADGRTATATTTVLDAVDDLVARTLDAMKTAPADPTWPGLTPPGPAGAGADADEATGRADPAERAQRVRAFVRAAGGLETAGYCSTSRTRITYANSAGQSVQGTTTQAALDGIARTATSDGLTRRAGPRLAELDGAILGARAAAKARAGADPIELPPGRYEVVLEPTAVADVLQMLAIYGFNAKAVHERRSFVELGAAQFDPSVTIVDDLGRPGATGIAFDAEGTPRKRLVLVDAGVPSAVAHDRRTAAVEGVESTGHAIPGGASFGAVPTSIALVPPAEEPVHEVDGPAADSSVAALVAGVERGLLVTDNHYTRVLDPRTLVVTGLTRNGVWLIEDGKITAPVRNFRFTQSYPQAMAPGAVLGVGTHAVGLPVGWSETTLTAPALRLASWNYTGNASG